jgi:hypothetical protein
MHAKWNRKQGDYNCNCNVYRRGAETRSTAEATTLLVAFKMLLF